MNLGFVNFLVFHQDSIKIASEISQNDQKHSLFTLSNSVIRVVNLTYVDPVDLHRL